MLHFPFSACASAVALTLAIGAAQAQTEVTAVLAGHAALPASTSVAAPELSLIHI